MKKVIELEEAKSFRLLPFSISRRCFVSLSLIIMDDIQVNMNEAFHNNISSILVSKIKLDFYIFCW